MTAEKLIAVAANVVARADWSKPADAVLRATLREHGGISREEGGTIGGAVFAYYRWRGWLGQKAEVKHAIYRALELDELFRKRPQSISEEGLRRAIPRWVAGEMDVSTEWLRALQTEPVLWLRARPGQGGGLAEKLPGATPSECVQDALSYAGREDLFRTVEFHAGEFEIQDISSQAVGLACAPQPGETWWDACAGEGGKTLHLCDLMGYRGRVWASDRAEWRLQRLKRRAARAKVFNYRSISWDGGAKLPVKTKFYGILVDAPCSGLGTWQRNPHARWTTQRRDVHELADAQKRLVVHAAAALRPGGRLVYSVCTMTRQETTGVVDTIARLLPELEPMPIVLPWKKTAATNQVWLWPQEMAGNGMFIAAWRKPQPV
jgi:16S rRNA (cytosine967-C5)-methyltransferase